MGVPRVTSLEKVQEGCHYSGSAPDLTKALRMPAEVCPLLFTAFSVSALKYCSLLKQNLISCPHSSLTKALRTPAEVRALV